MIIIIFVVGQTNIIHSSAEKTKQKNVVIEKKIAHPLFF